MPNQTLNYGMKILKHVVILYVFFIMTMNVACISKKRIHTIDEHSESYKSGYEHGCKTAKSSSDLVFFLQKDEHRFENDSQYRHGWNVAFDECGRDEETLYRQDIDDTKAKESLDEKQIKEELRRRKIFERKDI